MEYSLFMLVQIQSPSLELKIRRRRIMALQTGFRFIRKIKRISLCNELLKFPVRRLSSRDTLFLGGEVSRPVH